jgi:hypothetical protein
MKNLYALTPGEFLVGERLQREGFAVYLPLKDVGIDLVAEKEGRWSRLQVKESRAYLTREGQAPWSSWTQLDAGTLRRAVEGGVDFFVFVVHALAEAGNRLRFDPFYVVISPSELDRRLSRYRSSPEDRSVYWHRDGETLWEVRQSGGRRVTEHHQVPERDFTPFLEGWPLLYDGLSDDPPHERGEGHAQRDS